MITDVRADGGLKFGSAFKFIQMSIGLRDQLGDGIWCGPVFFVVMVFRLAFGMG